MTDITKYDVRGPDNDHSAINHLYDTYREARDVATTRAIRNGEPWAVIELEFEYSDSSLVFTTDGSTIWPPKQDSDT
jgi:hypothetical protein